MSEKALHSEDSGDNNSPEPQTQNEILTLQMDGKVANEEELKEFVGKLTDSRKDDPFKLLAASMALATADPIINAARYRENVLQLLRQLSYATKVITTFGSYLKVMHDESPVAPDPNFSNWPESHLRALAGNCLSTLQAKLELAETQQSSYARMNSQLLELRAEKELFASNQANALSAAEARYDMLVERNKELQRQLGEIVEVNKFVVGVVDPVTHQATHYLLVTDQGNKSVKDVFKATLFATKRDARSVRARIVQTQKRRLRDRVKVETVKANHQLDTALDAVDAKYVVYSLSLSPATIVVVD